MSNVVRFPQPCPGVEPCDHSAREHLAFDSGLRAGEAGRVEGSCPSFGGDFNLRLAWLTGRDVGFSNREFDRESRAGRRRSPL